MEFLKELHKKNVIVRTDGFRLLEAIEVGRYKLSVQASTGHYCTPRVTFDLKHYSSMELAIYNKSGSMVSINRSSTLRKFIRYKELASCAGKLNKPSVVYGYVPIDLINDLYLYLKGVDGQNTIK